MFDLNETGLGLLIRALNGPCCCESGQCAPVHHHQDGTVTEDCLPPMDRWWNPIVSAIVEQHAS